MTPVSEAAWHRVCPATTIPNETGVAARFGRRQLAIFRVDEAVYAVDNVDPVTRAGVMARGLIGDRAGVLKVASPIYKESYALETGECLDSSGPRLETFAARVTAEGWIEVLVPVGARA